MRSSLRAREGLATTSSSGTAGGGTGIRRVPAGWLSLWTHLSCFSDGKFHLGKAWRSVLKAGCGTSSESRGGGTSRAERYGLRVQPSFLESVGVSLDEWWADAEGRRVRSGYRPRDPAAPAAPPSPRPRRPGRRHLHSRLVVTPAARADRVVGHRAADCSSRCSWAAPAQRRRPEFSMRHQSRFRGSRSRSGPLTSGNARTLTASATGWTGRGRCVPGRRRSPVSKLPETDEASTLSFPGAFPPRDVCARARAVSYSRPP